MNVLDLFCVALFYKNRLYHNKRFVFHYIDKYKFFKKHLDLKSLLTSIYND